jgi:hypothetical protein
MKPSSDIALFTTTLPSAAFVSLIRASPHECIRPALRRVRHAHGRSRARQTQGAATTAPA